MAARGPARLQCMVSICSTQGHSCVVSLKFITRFPVMIPREGVCGGRGSTMNYSQAEMSSHGWKRKFHFGLYLVVDRTRTMPVVFPTTSTAMKVRPTRFAVTFCEILHRIACFQCPTKRPDCVCFRDLARCSCLGVLTSLSE